LVPHYYLLEWRDPYKSTDYDKALARSSWSFYWDTANQKMVAFESRKRPGLVLWYFNGAYAWSENDPAINGPGKGYLLAVDSAPSEIELPGLGAFYKKETAGGHYDVKSDEAQAALAESYEKTVCFVRSRKYLPKGQRCRKVGAVGKLAIEGKKPLYSYEVINEYLPGARDRFRKVSELVDIRVRKGKRTYRLRDRSLRHYHTYDSPFSFEPFESGQLVHNVTDGALTKVETRPYPAVARFDDSSPDRWLNAKLPFGGVAIPKAGFSFEVVEPGSGAPSNSAATVRFRWKR